MTRGFAAVGAACLLIAGCVGPAAERTRAASAGPGASLARSLAAVPNLRIFSTMLNAAGPTGTGAVTVFAPTDQAFGRLAPDAVAALLKPENKAALIKLVKLHIVDEPLSSEALVQRVTAAGGRAILSTRAGERVTLSITGTTPTLTDSDGDKSYVEGADMRLTDGIVHVVNGVLVPRLD